MITVLIADNQTLTREGTTSLLANILDINVIGYASGPNELEQKINTYQPDVIIIDHSFNQRFSIADIKRLTSLANIGHILVLSNRQSRSKVLEVVNTGIKNIIFKECSREELVNAIYKTAKGEQFFCKNTFETLFGNKLIPEQIEVSQLSPRELEIIQLIAAGMTNNEIAEKLYLSFHTIKTHRKNIIKKLGFSFKNTAEFASFIEANSFI
jgi:DNA-binding NarL/FixJ family response regulator